MTSNRALKPYVPVLHGASADRPDELDTITTAETIHQALKRLGYRTEIRHLAIDMVEIETLAAERPLVVFNLVEAINGDAGLAHLAPAMMDYLSLPYTGGSASNWLETRSKCVVKQRLLEHGLPTPAWSHDGLGFAPDEQVIIKSTTEHASVGLDSRSVVLGKDAPAEILAREQTYGGDFFAEAFIDGREFNISAISSPHGPEILPIAEIKFVDFPADKPRIVDYEAKWDTDSFAYTNTVRRFEFSRPDDELLKNIRKQTKAVWHAFDLEGYCRVDFRVDPKGLPWILEINVNPCIADDAGFAAAAAQKDIDYDRLTERIVRIACDKQHSDRTYLENLARKDDLAQGRKELRR